MILTAKLIWYVLDNRLWPENATGRKIQILNRSLEWGEILKNIKK